MEFVEISARSLATKVLTTTSFRVSINASDTLGETLERDAIAFCFSSP